MKICIMGSGALGKLYGGLLVQAGHEVHFIARSEYESLKAHKQFSLHFREENQSQPIQVASVSQDPSPLARADLVILSTKTTANSQIASSLAHISPKSPLLIIQNGIGNEEFFSQFYSGPLFTGISSACATRNKLDVDIFAIGLLKIAPMTPSDLAVCQTIADLFDNRIKIQVSDDYKQLRWHKLLWNVPFCSLSIIYDKSSDEIAAKSPYAHIARGLMEEICQIASHEGVNIPSEFIETMLASTRKIEGYFPSMYWDYTHHKKMEVEYILENPLNLAKKHGLSTPLLELCVTKLKDLNR